MQQPLLPSGIETWRQEVGSWFATGLGPIRPNAYIVQTAIPNPRPSSLAVMIGLAGKEWRNKAG